MLSRLLRGDPMQDGCTARGRGLGMPPIWCAVELAAGARGCEAVAGSVSQPVMASAAAVPLSHTRGGGRV